jgi:hypothetical protein
VGVGLGDLPTGWIRRGIPTGESLEAKQKEKQQKNKISLPSRQVFYLAAEAFWPLNTVERGLLACWANGYQGSGAFQLLELGEGPWDADFPVSCGSMKPHGDQICLGKRAQGLGRSQVRKVRGWCWPYIHWSSPQEEAERVWRGQDDSLTL